HDGHGHHLDPQDMRTMGGLKRFMPTTRWTFLVSTLAIAGFPLLAGFFSKDEILFKAFEAGFNGVPTAWFAWGIGLVTALLTAIYMMRAYILTFEGEPRWPHADTIKPHESPWTMTLPLQVLGVLSLIAGFLGIPAVIKHGDWNWIHHYLGADYGGPVAEAHFEGHVGLAGEWALIALGASIAVVGLFLARKWYLAEGPAFDAKVESRFGGLYRWWQGKYFVDEAYDRAVVRPVVGGAEKAFAPFDKYFVDGLVNLVGYLTRGVSYLLRYIQNGVVQSYAVAIVFGVLLVVGLMLFG
ncbi:MAG: NADH-quinone oxidoreductase subunit L, partial [Rhodothermales bacterium]|nr:NADH-quinone oxidoreductase subunit L [Rhodothermales bacterium]